MSEKDDNGFPTEDEDRSEDPPRIPVKSDEEERSDFATEEPKT